MAGRLSVDRGAATWGVAAVAVALLLVALGSGGLRWFDAALAGYLLGTLFAVFGTVYRYRVWLRRPPTARLNRRGWEALRHRGAGGLIHLAGLAGSNLAAQTFIRPRSRLRWVAHQLVFWGCVLAALITFPLVFGWLHFESVGQDGAHYRAFVANVGTATFDARGIVGWLVFHALDVSAVLVLAGVFLFLSRRLRDPGAVATERSSDFLALAGLFAVSVTGLMLTASTLWMDGRFYTFLTTVHALTVILGLMYIPFGKLFHIFQRPANLGIQLYREAGAHGSQQRCRECGHEFASALQIADLKAVLPDVGFHYELADGGHYQDVCPVCRRRLVTLAQAARVGGFG
jgi:nitrate reductase gamma subunit